MIGGKLALHENEIRQEWNRRRNAKANVTFSLQLASFWDLFLFVNVEHELFSESHWLS